MRYIIDRFEGVYAVCENENKEIVYIEMNRIHSEVKEGDILVQREDGLSLDIDETNKRKENIRRLMEDLRI